MSLPWLAATCAVFCAARSSAYGTDTHNALTEVALTDSRCRVEAVLSSELGYPEGLGTQADGRSLFDWVRFGTVDEDSGTRSRHHYFDPIRNAGLTDFVYGRPSLLWAWRDPDNEFSWTQARKAQLQWLSGRSATARGEGAARAFECLGHVLHLLQDAAQPEHTRNDAHLPEPIGTGAPYERYCSERYGTPEALRGLGIDEPPAFLRERVMGEGLAPDPSFKAYWDTGQYAGAPFAGESPETGPLGIAEYSNFHFVTSKTMFTGDASQFLPNGLRLNLPAVAPTDRHFFPYPKLSESDFAGIAERLGGFPEQGLNVYRAGDRIEAPAQYLFYDHWRSIQGPGALFASGIRRPIPATEPPSVDLGMDDEVHEAMARRLLPKAAGYDIGLLNYFFRSGIQQTANIDALGLSHRIDLANVTMSGDGFGVGTWRILQDFPDGTRRPAAFSQADADYRLRTRGLHAGEVFSTRFNPDPRGGTRFFVVFAGSIGTEKDHAIAARSWEMAPFGVRARGVDRQTRIQCLRSGTEDDGFELVHTTPLGASGRRALRLRIPPGRFRISGCNVTFGAEREATVVFSDGRQAVGSGQVRISGISNVPGRKATVRASFNGGYVDARGRTRRFRRSFVARVPAVIWYR